MERRLYLDDWLEGRPERAPAETGPVNDDPFTSSPLAQRLRRFANEEKPRYAILVDGAWGVGKTFQVLETLKENRIGYFRVSLAGLASIDEMHAAILIASNPVAGRGVAQFKKIVPSFRGITGAAMVMGAGVFSAVAKAQLDLDRLLIVDDIERSTIDVRQVVGALNELVEHKGARLVLIANSREISKPDEGKGFDDIREKIVGPTYRVAADVPRAMTAFVAQIPCSSAVRETISEHEHIIKELYINSRMNSLRVLRLTLLDVSRFLEVWDENQRKNARAVDAAVRWLLPYIVAKYAGWFRAALPSREERVRIVVNHIPSKEKRAEFRLSTDKMDLDSKTKLEPEIADARALMEVAERFGDAAISSDELPNELLKDALEQDLYDKKKVQAALADSWFFAKPANDPPWKTITFYRQNSDKDLKEAVAELEHNFEAGRYVTAKDLAHSMMARLFLAQEEALDKSCDEIVAECRSMIDRLLEDGQLEPFPIVYDVYTGTLEFQMDLDEAHMQAFRHLMEHLEACRRRAREDTYDEIVERVLHTLREQGLQSWVPIPDTDQHLWDMQSVPVLKNADPDRFVDAWLQSPRPSWLLTKAWLEKRYHGPNVVRMEGVAEERVFVTGVIGRLNAEAASASGLHKRRLESLVFEGIEP